MNTKQRTIRRGKEQDAAPTPDATPNELLTTREAMAYLKISKPTIIRYSSSGILNPKRLPGGALRFRRSDLDAILA